MADGREHDRRELLTCLDDPLAEESTLAVHITTMRPVIGRWGLALVCTLRGMGRGVYQLRRTVASGNE